MNAFDECLSLLSGDMPVMGDGGSKVGGLLMSPHSEYNNWKWHIIWQDQSCVVHIWQNITILTYHKIWSTKCTISAITTPLNEGVCIYACDLIKTSIFLAVQWGQSSLWRSSYSTYSSDAIADSLIMCRDQVTTAVRITWRSRYTNGDITAMAIVSPLTNNLVSIAKT